MCDQRERESIVLKRERETHTHTHRTDDTYMYGQSVRSSRAGMALTCGSNAAMARAADAKLSFPQPCAKIPVDIHRHTDT